MMRCWAGMAMIMRPLVGSCTEIFTALRSGKRAVTFFSTSLARTRRG